MPLKRRVQPPRTYQRTYRGNSRQQPYRLQTSLPDSHTEVELRIPRGNAEERIAFTPLAKRRGTSAFICSTCNEPMQTHDAYSDSLLGDETEETQRLLPRQWTQTNNRTSWQLEESSRSMPDLLTQTSQSNSLMEGRDEDSASSGLDSSDSNLASRSLPLSIIPNTVPISNSANRISNFATPPNANQSISRPTVSNCDYPPAGVVQNSSIAISPVCDLQESHNIDSPDKLSNHDRCTEERSVSPLFDYDTASTLASFRLFPRSMSAMPPPSAHALQVAYRVIKHARNNKTPHESCLWCPDCSRLPILPVTGQCGHTRCTTCIQEHGACPCGVQAPNTLHVNTLVQDLTRKMLPKEHISRCLQLKSGVGRALIGRKPLHIPMSVNTRRRVVPGSTKNSRQMTPDLSPSVLMSPQARFAHARQLLAAGRYRDAAPHLARVAASSGPSANLARTLLAQAITIVSGGRDPRRLTQELYRAVRAQSAAAWLKPSDLECVLCYHSYTNPVSTPCGHVYCRTCIERSMDYRKSCALCLRSLEDFDLAATRETAFICAALASIDALSSPQPPDPDVIPIFVCTVAYPAIPCPLFIFDPRYWLMIRRVLESGSRKFGMVAYERDRTYSDYGTVLEVCDCVHLEDGRSILSTVGVSRFRVIERDVRDGCDVARIQPLTDIAPTEELAIWELRILATQISYKALLWLNSMNRTLRCEIEAAFGRLPHFEHRQEAWWDTPDGPAWLWWLIAILPLRSEIKILILSTKNLLKRMMAVSRTLEAIDQIAISAAATSECELRSAFTNAEEWLERSD